MSSVNFRPIGGTLHALYVYIDIHKFLQVGSYARFDISDALANKSDNTPSILFATHGAVEPSGH